MRNTAFLRQLSVAFGVFAAFGAAGVLRAEPKGLPHLDLEMTGPEYQRFTADLLAQEDGVSQELQDYLRIGQRNLEWLNHINAGRDATSQLALTSAEMQVGYPIDAPTVSNEEIIKSQYAAWLAATPESVKAVLLADGAYPDQPPVSDEEYMTAARAINKVYERSSRWLLQVPYLEEYKLEQKHDVRGYYYLSREADLDARLSAWSQLDDATKARLTPWLVGQCFNDEATTLEACNDELAAAAAAGTVKAFYDKYAATAQAAWNDFFAVPVERPDVTWTSAAPDALHIPFRDPANDLVLAYLRDNIEDEFKWNDWHLRLDFVTNDDEDTTHVVFEPGATPHVNDLGGSIITMDSNPSLSDYNTRWTIRHEYGHVLGFPDCYVEFYDAAAGAMVSYQLDIENLMCSRRGHFQQRHYDELARVYLKTAD
jgi:hypothetical protein